MYRLVVLCLAGCGRIAFDPLATRGDGGVDDDGGPCTEPFGIPVQITSGMDVKDPTLTDDELEMYTDDLAGSLQVWTRASTANPWGAPVPAMLPASNDAYNEYAASLTGDGLTLYFTSARMGGAPVMRSTRASRSAPWEAEEDSGARGAAGVRRDNLEIVYQDFTSPVRHMVRATTGVDFANDTALPGPINDGSSNGSPSLSRDGLELYFNSDRGGSIALYVARRASLTSEFATVEPLNIAGQMPTISADGRHLYFVLNGDNYDLWLASRCD